MITSVLAAHPDPDPFSIDIFIGFKSSQSIIAILGVGLDEELTHSVFPYPQRHIHPNNFDMKDSNVITFDDVFAMDPISSRCSM